MASVNSDESMARPTNLVRDVNTYGQSRIQVGNNYTEVHNYNEPSRNRCIADLRLTDPRDDKTRIEQTKGGLLKDSYKWILDHEDFRRWRDDRESRLLWIKGDAGKGKTMLLCGIIDELSQSQTEMTNASERGLFSNLGVKMSRRFTKLSLSLTPSRPLSFFFCQGTDSRLNGAVAVLRGLMYVLLYQQPSLVSHIQDRYDHAGRRLFEDTNALYTLSQALLSMLRDRRAKGCYMIIDALDECEQDLPQLLDFIVQSNTSASAHVKWIVSSRNRPDIEQQLHRAASQTRLSLELNGYHIAQAVNAYVDHQVMHLISLKGDKPLQDQVRDEMRRRAGGTFLWAALVAQELQKVQRWNVLGVLKEMPSGLTPLYERMMRRIQQLQPEDSEFCRLVISAATVAYRPLRLCELGVLSGLPRNVSGDLLSVVGMCASFLTARDDHIYLIHQSVKDFLTCKASNAIFQGGFADAHHTMFLKSIQIMSDTLRHDMYDLHHPGTSIDDVRRPEPDPLASVRYSCFYWIDHLRDAMSHGTSRPIDDLQSDGIVHQFLSKKYLYWLEALSLLRDMPEGVVTMTKLEILLEGTDRSRLADLVRDARRFILSHGWAIGKAPLQAYASALIFSPMQSMTRKLFEREEPNWIIIKPVMAEDWDACMATLEGHDDWVRSVAFSPDGQRFASASYDKTVKIWDATTGHCQATLKDHSAGTNAAAFSPDGQRLASASNDGTVKIWDVITGHCQVTLEGYGFTVRSVAFSPDGQRLASASGDKTVQIWDATTGQCQATLDGHGSGVDLLASRPAPPGDLSAGTNTVAFSPDGQRLASASNDGTLKIWDATTGHCQVTLEGYSFEVGSVAFSPDSQRLALASCGAVRVRDATTDQCQATPEGHGDLVISEAFSLLDRHPRVNSVAFSPDGQRLASASYDWTITIWDAITGHCQATLKGHSNIVNSVAFSPNGQRLISASDDKTVRVWDARTGHYIATPESHSNWVTSVAFSPDGQRLISTSKGAIKIWDATTGHCRVTLLGHSDWVSSVAFSPDGQRLASGSHETVKIWDTTTGLCQATLEVKGDWVRSVAFSPNGQRLALAAGNNTIKIWDAIIGEYHAILQGHQNAVYLLAFSPDTKRLISASWDETIKVWDAITGRYQVTLKDNGDHWVRSVAFSPDGQRLALVLGDNTIKIWDATTGHCQATLNVGGLSNTIRFDKTGACLLTDAGTFDLSMLSPSPPAALPASGLLHHPRQRQGYGISADGVWITYQGRNLLWLPSEYRPETSAIRGSIVALGCNSGRVLLFRFSGDAPR